MTHAPAAHHARTHPARTHRRRTAAALALAAPALFGLGTVTAPAASAAPAAPAACEAGSTVYSFKVNKIVLVTHSSAWRVAKGTKNPTFDSPLKMRRVITTKVTGAGNGVTGERVLAAAVKAVRKQSGSPSLTLTKLGVHTRNGPVDDGSTSIRYTADRNERYAVFRARPTWYGTWSAKTCGKTGVLAKGQWIAWRNIALGGFADCNDAQQPEPHLAQACADAY
jgi:hypothetical protein